MGKSSQAETGRKEIRHACTALALLSSEVGSASAPTGNMALYLCEQHLHHRLGVIFSQGKQAVHAAWENSALRIAWPYLRTCSFVNTKYLCPSSGP